MRGFVNRAVLLLAMTGLLTHCNKPETNRLQGYVEGEFVYVAAPAGGRLEHLSVQRGGQVKAGAPLFTLENASEKAVRDEAERRVGQARASLEDAKKGRRPSEIASLEAQLSQAEAALALAQETLARQEKLARTGANSVDDLDRARSSFDQSKQHVTQLQEDLKTAALGLRADQIAAAEAEVKAREAALAKAQWDFSQKAQTAERDALVFDTLYREGEWVAAGKPVVVLLPPANIKVRAFVPEPRIGSIRLGDIVHVTVDGPGEPFLGKVSYIFPQAEYTPPVIYSKESRDKLVFMIEVVFTPEVAAKLHPGQPVDLQPGP